MKHDPSVKNLIFDLGGVILDLSVDTTLQSFAKLSGFDKVRIDELYFSEEPFLHYEMGLIPDEEFREFVRKVYSIKSSSDDIDSVWCAMLLGLPLKKLQLMDKLKEHYNVYLLSNTNAIHIKHINEVILPATVKGATSLDTYFHKAYYSHIMKKRKPNADIFLEVLSDSGSLAEETLFFDDNRDNVEGAKMLGIKTAFVNTPTFILDYFDEA
ncbi:MAG: HAD family phosphatase [Chryseolinea sp.]